MRTFNLDEALKGAVCITRCGHKLIDLHLVTDNDIKPLAGVDIYHGRVLLSKGVSAHFFFMPDGREYYGLRNFDIVGMLEETEDVSKPVTGEDSTPLKEWTLVVKASDAQMSKIKDSFFYGNDTEIGCVKAIHRGNVFEEQRADIQVIVNELGG